MHYMEKHFELRVNPYKLLPGAKSVICFLMNYFPVADQEKNIPKISKYAYGKDYHKSSAQNLQFILARMKEKFGDFHGRGFVDSAPVLERSWAVLSGLGWVGKNGNLIHKSNGSFFFIATLIVDLELEYDAPIQPIIAVPVPAASTPALLRPLNRTKWWTAANAFHISPSN